MKDGPNDGIDLEMGLLDGGGSGLDSDTVLIP
eukprot:CAMPEP_0172195240 /NCGR_PEP_ID=MMETSP1050-20130122/26083_1 /TAXON_ID=233186 /ORGANISM="Cryptomonas curvata, Strain CCAP979/52" /LENGTH=31 /DNA_ID= /DNA_START= /DNA_END= /DNA_ORIENTATION=